MNRKLKYTLTMILFVVTIVISSNIYARNITTESFNVDAKVQVNGSMDVTETIVYSITGEYNGTYREILLTGNENTRGANNITVNSVKVDGQYFDYEEYTQSYGTDGKYNVNSVNGGKKIMVFMPSNNETRTVEISYTLYDVITVYNDTAELYWNFIGTGWDKGINYAKIRVQLPRNSEGTLKIYGHGPLNGNSRIIDSRTVELEVYNIPKNTATDARMLFSPDIVPAATKVNENKLQEIVTYEEALAESANAERNKLKTLMYIAYILVAISFVVPMITYIKFKKRMYKAKFDGEYYRELPEDYGPAVMNLCIGNANSKRYDMVATLLDLVRKKYITIEEYTIKKLLKDKKDYKLTLINTDFTTLNDQEQYFIREIIFTENKTETTLEDIKTENTKTRTSQRDAYYAYVKWTEKIKDVAIQNELLKNEKPTRQDKRFLWLPFVIGSISLFISAIFGKIFVIFGWILIMEHLIIRLNIYENKKKTEKGIEHKRMWLAFKRFLLDFSNMQDYDQKSLVLWEHFLVYAAGLGIAETVIKNLKIKFPTEFNDDIDSNMTVLYLCTNHDTFNSFNSSFTSLSNEAFSSPSSGNGSGGGFSGGGGGGRRWRRRRRLLKKVEYRI